MNLLVSCSFGVSEMARLNSIALMLQDAVPNAVIDGGGSRTNVDGVALTFPENKDVNAPDVGWNDVGERQEPVDPRWSAGLDDVEKAVNEGKAELWKQCSQILKSGKDHTKARIDPVRDREAKPGDVEDERLDVGCVIRHLDGIAWCTGSQIERGVAMVRES